MDFELCFIREKYFIHHSQFVKMLDAGNTDKQSKRTHLCIKININPNTFYIPLRNNLGSEIRKFGRIGHAVPSIKRPSAGLDYRYALIINDPSYIEPYVQKKIPETQYRIINNEYNKIQAEFNVYLRGFMKATRKNRVEKEPLFRESCLINFKNELGL